MSKPTDAPERQFDHFSIVPFKAICGADAPNQSTTQCPERTKCATCWHYWNEFKTSRASLAPGEESQLRARLVKALASCGLIAQPDGPIVEALLAALPEYHAPAGESKEVE